MQPAKFGTWGRHYLVTLPQMLRAERRSNFRDQALQHFGKDADGQEGVFEEQSNEAETAFATMKAPEPSLLVQPGAPAALGVPVAVGGSAPCAPAPVLPAEFMRGGGCFAPETLVTALGADGAPRRVPIDAVGPGDALLAADGSVARDRRHAYRPWRRRGVGARRRRTQWRRHALPRLARHLHLRSSSCSTASGASA